jgi:two-component system, NarL family, sensor histidine kinase UhpB
MGLREALQDLLISTAVTGNLRFTLDAAELDGKKVNNHIQLMLYRIAQEQISNILKYANATEARVKLSANDQYIRLIISDNGVGFDTTARRSGIGLKNIKNRARLYGGAVKIISSPGQGCTLKVIIPVK